MHKFKKGDIVICIHSTDVINKDEIGIVDEDSGIPFVRWNSGKYNCISQSKIELYQEISQELKVGDQVQIRTDLIDDGYYGDTYFNPDMRKYCGNIYTIKRKNKSTNGIITYTLELNGDFWYWSEEMFEKIIKKEENIERNTKSVMEENKMENKYALINLYYDKKVSEITTKFDTEIKKIEKEGITAIVLKDAILKDAEKQLNDLYLSQFTKEELEDYAVGKVVDMSNKPLTRGSININVSSNVGLNSSYINSDVKELKLVKEKELTTLANLRDEVKAHLALAENKEQVEEILFNYGILKLEKKALKLNI